MKLRAMIDGSAVAAVITDPRQPDNPIIACNKAFEELTGYSRDEVIGRNCRFLAGERAEPLLTREIRLAVSERRPVLSEIPNFKKNGTPFKNAVLIVPIFDENGELIYFLGSQSEVVDRPAAPDEPPSRKLAALSGRQQEVLRSLISGRRNKEIAKQLGITERTVKMHRAATLKALSVATSAEAIRLAVEAGWHIGNSLGPRTIGEPAEATLTSRD